MYFAFWNAIERFCISVGQSSLILGMFFVLGSWANYIFITAVITACGVFCVELDCELGSSQVWEQ